MKKRLVSIFLILLMIAAAVIPVAACAEDQAIDKTAGYYYVYTQNGKGLNVREAPGGDIVGSLKYGSRVYCYYFDCGNGWALIDFTYKHPVYGRGKYACYVSNRYLQKSKPAAKGKETKTVVEESTGSLEDLNAEFRTAKKVEQYTVFVRPTRASGWVNMRWAPSQKAELVATYSAGSELTVLQETKNWLMVEDLNTGNIGFIRKDFVTQ